MTDKFDKRLAHNSADTTVWHEEISEGENRKQEANQASDQEFNH
jgi:hypothetical protein